MNKTFKLFLVLLDIVAITVTSIWYYSTRDFEALAALIILIGGLITLIFKKSNEVDNDASVGIAMPAKVGSNNTNNNRQIVNVYSGGPSQPTNDPVSNMGNQNDISMETINALKHKVNILFIDDDNKFKVVKILKNAGWVNTRLVKDIKGFTEDALLTAQIIFVDVQGVGKMMDFHDEGLGLAASIKEKFPNKKVIIYSAEPKGDRFHSALRKADDMLEKNAEPYEFESIIEQMTRKLIVDGTL